MKSIKEILSSKRGRIGFAIVIAVVVIMALSFFIKPAHADGVGLSLATEITHDKRTRAGFIDYTGSFYSVYYGQWNSNEFNGTTRTAGAEYRRHFGNIFAGLGVAVLDQTTALNGTNDNFSLTVGYSFKYADAFCRHFSHGSQLNIAPDRANGGWNFCGGRWGF